MTEVGQNDAGDDDAENLFLYNDNSDAKLLSSRRQRFRTLMMFAGISERNIRETFILEYNRTSASAEREASTRQRGVVTHKSNHGGEQHISYYQNEPGRLAFTRFHYWTVRRDPQSS